MLLLLRLLLLPFFLFGGVVAFVWSGEINFLF